MLRFYFLLGLFTCLLSFSMSAAPSGDWGSEPAPLKEEVLKVNLEKVIQYLEKNNNRLDSNLFHHFHLLNDTFAKEYNQYLFIDNIGKLENGKAILNKDLRKEGTYPGGKRLEDIANWEEKAKTSVWTSWKQRRIDSIANADSLKYRKTLDTAIDTAKNGKGIRYFFYKIGQSNDSLKAAIVYKEVMNTMTKKKDTLLIGITIPEYQLAVQRAEVLSKTEKERSFLAIISAILLFCIVLILTYFFNKSRNTAQALKKLEKAIEASLNGVVLIDELGYITFCNQKIADRYGDGNKRNVKGKKLIDITSADTQMVESKLLQAKEKQPYIIYESEYKGQFYQTRLTFVKEIDAFIAIDTNVTQMRQIEEAIKHSPSGLAILDEDGNFEYFNPIMQKFFKTDTDSPAHQLLGQNAVKISLNPDGLSQAIERCKQTQQPQRYQIKTEDYKHHQIEVKKVEMTGKTKFVLVDSNLSNMYEFLKQVGHDAAAPLIASRKFLASLMRLTEQQPQLHNESSWAYEGVFDAIRYVESIYRYASLMTGIEIKGQEKADSHTFANVQLTEIQSLYESICKVYQARLIIEANEIVTVPIAPAIFSLLVINLISNALVRGNATEIVVSLVEDEENVKIIVKDNGTGIKEETLLDIKNKRFTGLGYRFINEATKGAFTLSSKLNIGTTATLFLAKKPLS